MFPFVMNVLLQKKKNKLSFETYSNHTYTIIVLIHSDVWGPCYVSSFQGFLYYVLFVDEFSRFSLVFLMKHKSKVFTYSSSFKTMVETQFDTKIKILRMDDMCKYCNTRFSQYLATNRIL